MYAPGDMAMPARRIVLRAEDTHVMPRGQRTAQLERVNLGPRLVPGQEVVDRVKDMQAPIIAPSPLQRCASVVLLAPAFFTYLSNQFNRSAMTCSSVSRAA